MDAGAAAFALLFVSRTPVDATGHGSAAALVDASAGSALAPTVIDGCPATPRGLTTRAPAAWSIAFDPTFRDKERFRDGRQMALYFVSHVGEGDTMSVTVTGDASRARASGFHGLGDLTLLRAPLDATVDPAPRRGADAGDLLVRSRDLAAGAPTPAGEPWLHVAVAIEEGAGYLARVRVAGDTLDRSETIPPEAAQKVGPRLVTDVSATLARTSRVTFDLSCGRPDAAAPTAEPKSAPKRLVVMAGVALLLLLGALVWRLVRRG